MQVYNTAPSVLLLALGSFGVVSNVTTMAVEKVDVELVEAVKQQDLATVRTLVSDGADVNATQPDGATAMHWAAFREDRELVKVLLDAGAEVNVPNELGATPLWVAAISGNADIVTQLLDAGADPNRALPEGETPIMTASRSGNVDAVRALLTRGADVNQAESSRGQTALMWATAQRHPAVVKALIDHGARLDARSRIRPRLVFADSTNASQFDQGVTVTEGGFTPLLFAARQGALESAKLLLAAGADVEETAPTGSSVLVVAAHSGHPSLVELLLAHGADPNANAAGYAALHVAVLRGDVTMIRSLLDNGADPNQRFERGTQVRRASQDWQLKPQHETATPFWLAAQYREPEIMRTLVAAGADPSLTTLERFAAVNARAGGVGPPRLVGGYVSPLMAVLRGRSDRGRLFLSGQAPADREHEEALALEAAQLAVDLGAEVNAVDQTGTTALHSAASINFTQVLRLLAESGADLNVKNKAGETPLSLAARAEARRARRTDTVEQGPSTADILRELGATE